MDGPFLTGEQVQARYHRDRTTIWRWLNDPDLGFPKPLKARRKSRNLWRLSDLEDWEKRMDEKSQAGRKGRVI